MGLSNAAHSLMIEVIGQHDSKSSGEWVWVDAFDVTTVSSTHAPPPTQESSTPIRIEQDSSAVVYTVVPGSPRLIRGPAAGGS
jgi:hypothetical protein